MGASVLSTSILLVQCDISLTECISVSSGSDAEQMLTRAEGDWNGMEVQQELIARVAVRVRARLGADLQLTAQDATAWRYAIRARACEKVT